MKTIRIFLAAAALMLVACTPKLPFDNPYGHNHGNGNGNDYGHGNGNSNGGGNDRPAVSIQNPHMGHEWVDLGLSVYWSTCNLGAKSPEQYGDYYAWGEIAPQKDGKYEWDSYEWYYIEGDALTKYNLNSKYGNVDNKAILDDDDDASHVQWEGTWYMPTTEEILELINGCKWTKKTYKNVAGYEGVSKKNGNSIFVPCNGAISDSKLQNEDYPTFWSCELDNSGQEDDSLYGFCFMYGKYDSGGAAYTRYCGLAIRPVIPLELLTKSGRARSTRRPVTMADDGAKAKVAVEGGCRPSAN
ncbi:MAG: hypothetical protein J6W82_00880 [Bacteroidales bacterium]|nr:hypothetical protein [Bacteroidales bacterium]